MYIISTTPHLLYTNLKLGKGNHPGSSHAKCVKPPSRSAYSWATCSSRRDLISRPRENTYQLWTFLFLFFSSSTHDPENTDQLKTFLFLYFSSNTEQHIPHAYISTFKSYEFCSAVMKWSHKCFKNTKV